jgi:hypothetical protein
MIKCGTNVGICYMPAMIDVGVKCRSSMENDDVIVMCHLPHY